MPLGSGQTPPRDGPAEMLKNFRGYLQTNAYASYESVVFESAGRIIPVGCWAHARREFYDARLNQGYEAHYVLSLAPKQAGYIT